MTNKKFETRKVRLGSIVVTENVNVRQLDFDHVSELQEWMLNEDAGYGVENWQAKWKGEFLGVEVNGEIHLYDGFHTHRAAHTAFGEDHEVEVQVNVDQDIPEEFRLPALLAASANSDHGKPRSNADKREAIDRWLKCEIAEDSNQWTDGYIAKMARVGKSTVMKRDKALAEELGEDYVRPDVRASMRNGEIVWVDVSGNRTAEAKPKPEAETQPEAETPEVTEAEETPEVNDGAEAEETPEVDEEGDEEETPEVDEEGDEEETPEVDESDEEGDEDSDESDESDEEVDEVDEDSDESEVDEEGEEEETPEVDEEGDEEETPEVDEEGDEVDEDSDESEVEETPEVHEPLLPNGKVNPQYVVEGNTEMLQQVVGNSIKGHMTPMVSLSYADVLQLQDLIAQLHPENVAGSCNRHVRKAWAQMHEILTNIGAKLPAVIKEKAKADAAAAAAESAG